LYCIVVLYYAKILEDNKSYWNNLISTSSLWTVWILHHNTSMPHECTRLFLNLFQICKYLHTCSLDKIILLIAARNTENSTSLFWSENLPLPSCPFDQDVSILGCFIMGQFNHNWKLRLQTEDTTLSGYNLTTIDYLHAHQKSKHNTITLYILLLILQYDFTEP